DHFGTFETEASWRYRRYQPVLARHGDKTPIGRQHAEQGLSVLRHEGVEIDERAIFSGTRSATPLSPCRHRNDLTVEEVLARAGIPVKVGAYTSCPALRSLGASSRQTTPPAQLPCTRTNVAIASSPHSATVAG